MQTFTVHAPCMTLHSSIDTDTPQTQHALRTAPQPHTPTHFPSTSWPPELRSPPPVLPQLAALEHHERNRAGSELPAWDDVGAMTHDGYPTAFFPGARRF